MSTIREFAHDYRRIEDKRNSRTSDILLPQRINHRQKRKAVEIGVATADPADPVFTHQHCGMDVMHDAASQIWEFL